MKRYVISIVGVLIFAASFFLTGVKQPSIDNDIIGYLCAYTTIALPWTSDGWRMLHQEPVKFFSILLSGWINPVFLFSFILLLINPNNRLAGILRIALLFMFAACWIVFYKEHLHPAIGYFVWTAAMLLTLFAGKFFPAAKSAGTIG